MSNVTVKTVDELPTKFGGGFKLVRAGLDISAFGVQAIDMPPNADQYPEHDHAEDGQEELYTALAGEATLKAGGEQIQLKPDVFVKVGPGVKRKVFTGDSNARILVVGGVPGQAYEIPEYSRPD